MIRDRHHIDVDVHVGLFNFRHLLRMDLVMLLLVFLLASLGLVILYSAKYSPDYGAFSEAHYWHRQALYFLVGLAVAFVLVCLDHRFLVSMGPLMYAVAIGLLIGVLLVGTEGKNAQRWLSFGPFRLQPSEQSKLVLVYMLTWYLTTIGERVRRLPYLLLAFVIAAVPSALILKQPNLGTAMTLPPITFAMLYIAGCKRWHLLMIILIGLAAAPVGWSQMKPYQRDRILTFLNPEQDPQGKGWHTIQSKITVGSGELSGKGFLKGTQTRLRYLPEHHTDFIFSVLAEEHGLIGAMVVLSLFAAFLLRGLQFARDCPEMSGSLLATGAVTIMAVHVFVNVAITLGLMPVTGLPLPFFSFGGSFYLTTMMCVGVLLNVNIRRGMFER